MWKMKLIVIDGKEWDNVEKETHEDRYISIIEWVADMVSSLRWPLGIL